MKRLIIISNRLPVSIAREKGEFSYTESVGGVATGISSLSEPRQRLWFGWPGLPSDRLKIDDKKKIAEGLNERGCEPVFLSNKDINEFYSGFSNKTIWPLFHYFSEFTFFEEHYWKSYQQVNQLFCDAIIDKVTEDDVIWVHDYHLMLLPQMIRQKLPNAKIGFFLHIPFPSFELLRNLPWRDEILQGILGSDLIGFHEYDYVRHFLSSVYRICGVEHQLNSLFVDGRQIKVDAFPMGINYEKYAKSSQLEEVKEQMALLEKNGTKIVLSVDRLDYTKGILRRLEAFDWFLSKHPKYHGKVSMVMVAVPSRTKVEQYAILREKIEKCVGRINGSYGNMNWTPVSYMYRSLPFEQLSAIYNIADVALITPLRDGMNLVAKEFVATQKDKKHQGMLILSEMAGAASELSEAIVINPHDKESIVKAIKDALEMKQEDRRSRNMSMQKRISRYTVGRWANDFIVSLEGVKQQQSNQPTKQFSPKIQKQTIEQYNKAKKRLILLDYDGTLSEFKKQPQDAGPDSELLNILKKLCKSEKNQTVVISGRDSETLDNWLGKLPINLVAEHGAFLRPKGRKWETTVLHDNQWKDVIRPILELSVDRTPGSFIEEKKFALVWHFRKSEPDLAKLRIQELKDTLVMMAANLNIGVFEGNKIIEVKPVTINKGQAVRNWLDTEKWDFVFCAGDDYTDEDMFTALGPKDVSCKIGTGLSSARFRVASPTKLKNFLKNLIGK